MMQKFRICAGAVKVLSAKLLMGISWWGRVSGPVPGYRGRAPTDTIARGLIRLCCEHGVAVEDVSADSQRHENLVFNEAPKFIRQLQKPETPVPRRPSSRASSWASTRSRGAFHRARPPRSPRAARSPATACRPRTAPAGWSTRPISTAAPIPARSSGPGWSTRTTRRAARTGRCWWWAVTAARCSA